MHHLCPGSRRPWDASWAPREEIMLREMAKKTEGYDWDLVAEEVGRSDFVILILCSPTIADRCELVRQSPEFEDSHLRFQFRIST